MDEYAHKSVLLGETLEFLAVKPGAWYLDCTLGDGGHSLEILQTGGKVVGLDVDPDALTRTQTKFDSYGIESDNYRLIKGNFRDLRELVGDQKFSGVIFDLGVSTLQLKDPKKGFSLFGEEELDMRLDPGLGVKASDLINVLNEKELSKIFSQFGQDSASWRVAQAIVRSRPLKTTKQLADLVEKVIGEKKGYTHPATQIFQALRMVVNDELGSLEEALPQALGVLEGSGRVVVISFHSLEDKIVKNYFRNWEHDGLGKNLTDKPVVPTSEEVNQNIRSRSAKLRSFEKNV